VTGSTEDRNKEFNRPVSPELSERSSLDSDRPHASSHSTSSNDSSDSDDGVTNSSNVVDGDTKVWLLNLL
jgi:hypothetical protein